MSAIFSSHIRGYSANAFVDSLRLSDVAQWITGTSYAIGDIVFSGTRKYIASSAGVSGVSTPSHAIGASSDGGVTWVFIENFYSNDNNYKNNLYLFYAKNSEWPSELSPDYPNASFEKEYTILNDIIAMKKVVPDHVKMATRRYNWTSGIIYSQFDSAKDPFSNTDYPTPFYVLNSNNDLYKCINNNNGIASTSEPSGVSLEHIITADGYSWFYLGTLSAANALLMSSDFIPLDSKTVDDSSNQWLVQENAKKRSISTFTKKGQNSTFAGSPTVTVFGDGTSATASAIKDGSNNISRLIVSNPGSGYSKDATFVEVKNAGSLGSGALATAEIWTNSINTPTISNAGSGYTEATAAVVANSTGTGATLEVVLGDIGTADEGKIVGITVTNPGKDYATGATITISGDGLNAAASVTINSAGIVGAITITPGSAGTLYASANVIIVGNGTSATANVTSINGGTGAIEEITMITRGTGYTAAKVYIIPGTSGAIGYPVMAPVQGHGSNIAAELGANTILINARINSGTDADYFEIDSNGFRQVGLLSNGIDKATDEDCLKNLYIGPAHSEYSNSGSVLNKIKQSTGYPLYINNVLKTVRVSNQEEDIKIAISF